MNGGHQTLQNSEVVIDDFAHGSQAIGSATSITDLKKWGKILIIFHSRLSLLIFGNKLKYKLLSGGLWTF